MYTFPISWAFPLAYLILKDLTKYDSLLDILTWYFCRIMARFSRTFHFFPLYINAYSTYSQLPFKCGRLLHPQLESAPCCGDRGPLNMPLYHNIEEIKRSRVSPANIGGAAMLHVHAACGNMWRGYLRLLYNVVPSLFADKSIIHIFFFHFPRFAVYEINWKWTRRKCR
jgi:hypothetical protein